MMAADTYLVNGVDLRSFAWRITTAEGLQDAPEFRGDDLPVPGQHGTLDLEADPTAPRRRYGPGQITFTMWVKGVDESTGLAPSDEDDLSVYFANLDKLQRLFNARQLLIDHPRPDGTRRAVAKLAAPLRPVREPSSPKFGQFTVACTIPGAFWLGPADVTVSATLASGGVLGLSAFATCDAPITDGVVTIAAGATQIPNPRLIQGGTFVGYDGIVPAGKSLAIDCSAWQTSPGAAGGWTTTDSLIVYGPGPSWFEFDPTQTPPAAVFTHTGTGTATVSYTARPKHLTS